MLPSEAILPLGLAALVILAAGAVVFYVLEPDPLRYSRKERLAYCYPLGLVALGIPMFAASWAGLHLRVAPVALSVLAAGGIAYLIRRVPLRHYFGSQRDAPARQPLTEIEWVLLGIIVACLGARTIASFLIPLHDWDGICIWGLKGKVIFYDTAGRTGYFERAELAYSHPVYPLSVPLMYAWISTVLGKWDDWAVTALNPLNLVALVTLLYATIRRTCSRTAALAVAAILASLPALLHYTECAQADVPLMLVSSAALFLLVDWMQSRRISSILLAGFLAAGAVFVKEEGKIIVSAHLVAAVVFTLLAAPAAFRKTLFGHLGCYAGLVLLWNLPWLLFQQQLPPDDQFTGVSLARLRWHEIPTLALTLVQNATYLVNGVGLPKWNFLWPILVIVVALSRTWRATPWNYLLLIFVVHLSGVAAIWLCTSDPLTLSANEFGWERYTLTMSPPLWLVFGKSIDEWWNIWRNAQAQASQGK